MPQTDVAVEQVVALTDDVRALIGELDTELALAYAPEQRHGLDGEAIFKPHMRFFLARCDGAAVGCGGVALFDGFAEVKHVRARRRSRSRYRPGAARRRVVTEEQRSLRRNRRVRDGAGGFSAPC